MRRRDYLRAVQAGALGTTVGLAGCFGDGNGGDGMGTPTPTSPGGEEQTMELWHDKGKNPNWNPIFQASTPTLNQITEGVNVEVVPYQSTDSYQGAIRPVFGTKNGPGVFTWWGGARLKNMVDQGYAHDITSIWDEHIDAGRYPESIKNVFSFGGKAYGIPNQVSYWVVWYNKQTFEDLGVQPPSTWDEFLSLNDTIMEESGGDTLPILNPLNPPWTGFIWFEELVMRQSLDFYNRLCRGKAKYTDDTAVQALEMMGDLMQKGYFGERSVAFSKGLDQIPRDMENGNYAMTLIGSWISGVFSGADVDFSKYGYFELPAVNPDMSGKLIIEPGPFVMHKGYPDASALDEVADGLLSTEFRQVWMENLGNIPVNTEVDTGYLGETMTQLGEDTASGKFDFPLRYWENTSPQVAVPASKAMKEIYQKPDKAMSVARKLDDIRKQVYG